MAKRVKNPDVLMNNSAVTEILEPAGEGVRLNLSSSAAMYIKTGNCQNQGARPYQEDAFGYSNITDSDILSEKGMFAILSDGMGGLTNGKEVAEYTVQATKAMFDNINPKMNICEQLLNITRYVNQNICEKYSGGRSGATLVLAYIFKNRLYWVCVGDSRLYCIRNGVMFSMNEDHDYKNQLYRDYIRHGGDLDAIENDRQKDSLVCYIGKKDIPYYDVSIRGYKIKPNDIFVLCSDGIYNGISEEAVAEIAQKTGAQAACETIVGSVVSRKLPGQDNMTVMVIKCDKHN